MCGHGDDNITCGPGVVIVSMYSYYCHVQSKKFKSDSNLLEMAMMVCWDKFVHTSQP